MSSVIMQGFCSKLTNEFDKRYNQLLGLDSQLTTYINSLKVNIASNSGYSPHALIRQFERDVASNVNNMVPDLTQFDEIYTLINACLFTRNNSMLSKPSTMARGLENFVKSNAYNTLNNLASLIPTEFNLGNTINNLKNQLKTSQVNLLVPESIQALNCMSAICGTDITSRIAQLQAFLTKFNINSIGDFETSLFLAGEGLVAPIIQSIERVTDQIEYVYDQIENSFSSGIDRLKTLFPDDDDDE